MATMLQQALVHVQVRKTASSKQSQQSTQHTKSKFEGVEVVVVVKTPFEDGLDESGLRGCHVCDCMRHGTCSCGDAAAFR